MTAATVDGVGELRELYGRYKNLALATGAALVLDADTDGLAEEAAVLLADCHSAEIASLETQLAACVGAAEELHALLMGRGDVDSVRATHSRLRQEVWKVVPCEYVPCSAAHQHPSKR